jgi:predicted MPP superfamily phosphohydrolase
MIKQLAIIFLCFTSIVIISSPNLDRTDNAINSLENNYNIDTLKINDGPYIIISKDSLIEMNVVNGKLESNTWGLNTKKTQFEVEFSVYNNVRSIAALSDLHGQYHLAIKILQNNGIIDQNLNWTFGKGHLVIVGDIFDRGDKVTELLWFVYDLEKQALDSGGKVHYLLGNHEYMIMQKDLRYINKKYRLTEQLLKTPYNELYGKQTLIGRWLRSKSTILKINDNIFVHGGISQEFLDDAFNLDETNQMMRRSLYEDEKEVKWDSLYKKYNYSHSPIWYRGYFTDSLKKGQVNKILKKLDVRHIIVGHTSQTKIESLFKDKIFAVDSSIKLGEYGEILLIENGKFYRGTIEGEKIELK